MMSVEAFVLAQHAAGRSLRKIAEPTDRRIRRNGTF